MTRDGALMELNAGCRLPNNHSAGATDADGSTASDPSQQTETPKDTNK